MAQISLPIDQPVEKPFEDVREVRRAGESVVRLNEEAQGMASAGLQIEYHIREAQKHNDKLAADNQFNAAYMGMQDELSKATNSRDVDGILKSWNSKIAGIVQTWGESPASHEIELISQGYIPHMEHQAQVRQIDLMGKENQVSLGNLAKGLWSAVVDPATAAAASSKYNNAVDDAVTAKLMPDWQAQIAKDAFRKGTQTTILDRAASSPNPADNKAGLDDIVQHPEHYPDLAPHEKAAYKEKLESAFRVNTDFMQKVGEKQFVDRELPNFRKMYSRSDGSFDLDGALKEIDRREALPESDPNHISATLGGDQLRAHLRADDADRKDIQNEKDQKDAEKYAPMVDEKKISLSQIWGLRDTHQISQRTAAALERMVQANTRIEREEVRGERGEERAERQEARWEQEEKGKQSFSRLMQIAASGKAVDFQKDIAPLLMSGDITPTQVRQAMEMSAIAGKDPGAKMGLGMIQHSSLFSTPTDETNRDMAELGLTFTEMVQQHPEIKGQKAIDLANSMLTEAKEKSVQQAITDAFSWKPGTPAQPVDRWWTLLARWGHPTAAATNPQQPAELKVGDVKIWQGSKWKYKGGDRHDPKSWEKQ